MELDPKRFFLYAGVLAAGGVGGYYASQRGLVPKPVTTALTPTTQPEGQPVVERDPHPTPANAATLSSAMPAAPGPTCDDSVGAPEDCPLGAPTAEGEGCGNYAQNRCKEFKASFKPKVATAAVDCLRRLKPHELCDKARVDLCGHLSLTHACPEPVEPRLADTPRPGSVDVICTAILDGCQGAPLGPTMSDCRQTLSGMTDVGRARMTACMKKACTTKGLLGCEALAEPPK